MSAVAYKIVLNGGPLDGHHAEVSEHVLQSMETRPHVFRGMLDYVGATYDIGDRLVGKKRLGGLYRISLAGGNEAIYHGPVDE